MAQPCPDCEEIVYYSCGSCEVCKQTEDDHPGRILQEKEGVEDTLVCPVCGYESDGDHWWVLEIESLLKSRGVETLTELLDLGGGYHE